MNYQIDLGSKRYVLPSDDSYWDSNKPIFSRLQSHKGETVLGIRDFIQWRLLKKAAHGFSAIKYSGESNKDSRKTKAALFISKANLTAEIISAVHSVFKEHSGNESE